MLLVSSHQKSSSCSYFTVAYAWSCLFSVKECKCKMPRQSHILRFIKVALSCSCAAEGESQGSQDPGWHSVGGGNVIPTITAWVLLPLACSHPHPSECDRSGGWRPCTASLPSEHLWKTENCHFRFSALRSLSGCNQSIAAVVFRGLWGQPWKVCPRAAHFLAIMLLSCVI